MFDALKRILGVNPLRPNWRAIAAWAREEGHQVKRVREGDGVVVEGRFEDDVPWRLEWGASQREYIAPRELRLRIEAGLAPDLQMLVLTRSLGEKLERETFEQFTHTTQTYVDTAAPEEMRWLATFSRARLAGAKSLRNRYFAVAMEPAAVAAWVDRDLAACLDDVATTLLAGDPPFVLMTLRGRIYLRVQAPRAEPPLFSQALALGRAAVGEARRISRFRLDTGDWPASATTASQLSSIGSTHQ